MLVTIYNFFKGIPPVMTGEEMAKCEVPDYLNMFSYLTLIYETFRGEIPHIKHPKLVSVTKMLMCLWPFK